MSALFDIRGLEKIYDDGTKALRGITFSVSKGEFVALMGPSGSGKSTLLHMLGFLDRPSGGTYRFNDKNALSYSDDALALMRNREFGFVFQMFNLLRRTTVLENVKLPLLYSNIPESEWDARAKKSLDAVGMTHRLFHDVAALSGGEKQRVAIARALITNPGIVFADEPTGNLDSKSGQAVMEIFERLHSEEKTIFLITHETYTAEYAERIIHIKDGVVERDEKVLHRRHAGSGFHK